MVSFSLSVEEKEALRISLKKCSKAHAIRIIAILALSGGHSFALVANILGIDDDTVRRYLNLYKEKGLEGLLENHYKGRACQLDPTQQAALITHLKTNVYTLCK